MSSFGSAFSLVVFGALLAVTAVGLLRWALVSPAAAQVMVVVGGIMLIGASVAIGVVWWHYSNG